MKLAAAYYHIAYSDKEHNFLSFAWTCADVLYKVRQNHLLKLRHMNPEVMVKHFSFNPICDGLSDYITTFKNNSTGYNTFVKEYGKLPIISDYIKVYQGLADWMFFMVEWCKMHRIVYSEKFNNIDNNAHGNRGDGETNLQLRPITIVYMILKYGMGKLDLTVSKFFEKVRFKKHFNFIFYFQPGKVVEMLENEQVVDLNSQDGGIGAKFIGLLQFLSSRDFQILKCLTFNEFDYLYGLFNGEWIYIQKIAQESFYKICLTNDFSTLPVNSRNRSNVVVSKKNGGSTLTTARCYNGVSFMVETLREGTHQLTD